ncbi:unnamed protein product [Spirodela intermedia]|uniref:Uncharacterized protein n=1 Tax=Spirodela intermedia TaxID=51605 RepID=A0A7I8JTQ2_SPIIN|nr:unnamed protein product [Spirodela intermedia]CAA6673556.1 unnamed protein product [Spirodela intermedia]
MEKAGEEPRERMVRWEKFLPRMSLRVLLVEADDSTRQIIAALLRKCSYKVAAASSGFEAWEILKEKPHNIDLVLTEVELPNVSGYGLLSMIMEHDNSSKEDPSDRETSVKIAMSTGRFGDRNVQYDNNEQSFGQSSSSREVDLTAPAEHQSHHNYGLKRRRVLQAGVPNDQVLGVDNSQKFKPQLELSLRKIQDENAEKKVKDVSRLNHSHSSAFSRYSARITPSPLPQSTDLGAEEPRGSPGDGSGPSGENPEPTNAKSPGLQKRDGRNPQPNPEFPALPRPATGAAHDDPRSGYGSVIRTVFYSQSGPHVWSLSPGVDQPSLPCRPDREIVNVPGEKTHQPKAPCFVHHRSERGSPAHISGVNVESVHGGGSVLTCDGAELTNLQQRSMQREAALNKFRLKRKERCYEKKVRYQSRKRLAEQRPRVKGQFVRQAKPDL